MAEMDAPHFHDDEADRKKLEAIRWPDGPVCPHCGGMEKATVLKGKSTRPGVWKCGHCFKPFSVTVGTVFERSHVALHKWFQAVYLLCCSKKGISSKQIERMLGVTYKTAWFMTHRIREAMKDGGPFRALGGEGQVVEADEAYWGVQKKPRKNKAGASHKMKIFSLVERGGPVRSFHMKEITKSTVRKVLVQNVDRETYLATDEANLYRGIAKEFEGHFRVNHSKGEYRRGKLGYTNTIEGYFSIFKRGMTGIYQHCGEKHLKRYLTEFDFRYNTRKMTDRDRTSEAMKGIEGRRLMYGGSRP
jgi:transposase-like protein